MTFELNTIVCADALEFIKSLPDKGVDAVITDPPYGLYGKANVTRPDTGGEHNRINEEWDAEVPLAWMELVQRTLKPGASVIVFGTGLGSIHYVAVEGLRLGWKLINDITWFKHDAAPNFTGRLLTESTESALWFCPNGTGWTYNLDVAKAHNSGINLRNVWKFGQTRGTRYHPTQKPLELMRRCVELFTNPGDLILDPFAGSGTTLVAAQQLGRNFLGCDITESYVAMARERLAKPFTVSMFD